MNRILVINTGSTSTKIAVFEDDQELFDCNVEHPAAVLKRCGSLNAQLPLRKDEIQKALDGSGLAQGGFDAIAARGGTFGMAQGGAYLVEEKLLDACKSPVTNHASNLSAILAAEFAEQFGCKAYIYDAVCVNEVAGLAEVNRRPFSHVLNTRATARNVAAALGRRYEEMTFIVAHMGGGISINLHVKGKIVDLCSDDEGPMSPERAGKLNGKAYVELCYSGKYTESEMMRHIKGEGGLMSHLGTNSLLETERRIDTGDAHAGFILDAMAYQISKEIGALATAACGNVDGIILTGGCAHSERLNGAIRRRVSFLAPVTVVPGSMEMRALAEGVMRVLAGKEAARVYTEAKE